MRKHTSNATPLLIVASLLVLLGLVYVAEAAPKPKKLNEPPAGFIALFNGKDLTGWKGLLKGPYDKPAKRGELTLNKLKELQKEANENMRTHWKVVDGVLVFDGKGRSLCTAKDYGNFEMLVDWKIEEGGDSGIYLRGLPQVQIWDTKLPNGKVGSGGLYNNKKNPDKPLKVADKPVGEWNTFRIIMVGDIVTVFLNDVLVVDHVVLENLWEQGKPIPAREQIELQSHGNTLYFRNIYIKPLNELTECEKEAGFKMLFNGKDMTGWTNQDGGVHEGYITKDGMIMVEPQRAGGNLYTTDQYGNFIIRFEFKLPPGANNGLGIRTPRGVNAAYNGMELQILDNTADKYKNLKPYQYHGSIYGVVPAKRGYLNPVGEWNYQEVIARGKQITVNLNGETIVDADIEKESTPSTRDGRDHPGLQREKGYIAFCGHGDRLAFRNLRIKSLD